MRVLQEEITQCCVNDKRLTEYTGSHCRLCYRWIEEEKTSQSCYHWAVRCSGCTLSYQLTLLAWLIATVSDQRLTKPRSSKYSLSSLAFRIGLYTHYLRKLMSKRITFFLKNHSLLEQTCPRMQAHPHRLGIYNVKDCPRLLYSLRVQMRVVTGMLLWSLEKNLICYFPNPNVLAGVNTGVFCVLLTIRGESEECMHACIPKRGTWHFKLLGKHDKP